MMPPAAPLLQRSCWTSTESEVAPGTEASISHAGRIRARQPKCRDAQTFAIFPPRLCWQFVRLELGDDRERFEHLCVESAGNRVAEITSHSPSCIDERDCERDPDQSAHL